MWKDGSGEFILLPASIPFKEWEPVDINEDHRYCIAKVSFTHINKPEMAQHAQKLAAYFEDIDIQKEAVINCSKI
jgi:hypothetical protein